MAFLDELKQLSEQIRKRQPNVKGEEATKQALILPFLQLLAFDIYDPTVVRPEFIADFAKKKANGQMEKVDFALHAAGHPIIFIECKAVDAQLPAHDAQLARYFNAVTSVQGHGDLFRREPRTGAAVVPPVLRQRVDEVRHSSNALRSSEIVAGCNGCDVRQRVGNPRECHFRRRCRSVRGGYPGRVRGRSAAQGC